MKTLICLVIFIFDGASVFSTVYTSPTEGAIQIATFLDGYPKTGGVVTLIDWLRTLGACFQL